MVSLCKTHKCARSSEWTRKPPQRWNTELSAGRESAVGVDAPSRGCRAGWWVEMTPGSLAHTNTAVSGSLLQHPGGRRQGLPHSRQTPSGRGPRGALADRGLWLVTHPGKPKALRWSQYIFGLSTSDRYYGSTFLSWNLKPKALSCGSAEDSQIAKYLVVNLKGNIKKYNLLFIVNYEVAKTFRFGIYIWESGQRTDLRSVSDCRSSSQFLVELEKNGLNKQKGNNFCLFCFKHGAN